MGWFQTGAKPLPRLMLIKLHDAISWHHRTWSTLVQVMAWCLTAPSHYLNQCWLIISEFSWHLLSSGQFHRKCSKKSFLDVSLKIINWLISPWTKWPPSSGRHFQMHFLEWKCINFDYYLTEICSQGPNQQIPALVQIMAWRLPGNKPLSEPMMVSFLTHICVTRPQCVKDCNCISQAAMS